MNEIKRFQIRGVPGLVQRVNFNGRIVDYWSPYQPTGHLLIAHDGQNVFDRRTATHLKTWEMAQSALRVSEKLGIAPPAIIGVFHSSTPENPWGRAKDLSPQDPFQTTVQVLAKISGDMKKEDLAGNAYLSQITDEIAPTITQSLGLDLPSLDTAIIGSSMGGLASLYALGKRPDFFTTALALSTHWPIGGNPLVDALLDPLPKPGRHKVWMSHGDKGLDADYAPFQKYADEKMSQLGWRLGREFQTHVYKKSGHNERSWAKYLDQPMTFWLSGL